VELVCVCVIFFFKQKTAYEIVDCDWSSDVCSSDLHPVTGEKTFFNQVQLHHIFCLDPDAREDLLALFGEQRMPRHVYYGDGSPIEDEVMALVGELYEACAVRFDWHKGDVILLDTMLAAHARDPVEGPRKIVVAMGEMIERSALNVAHSETEQGRGRSMSTAQQGTVDAGLALLVEQQQHLDARQQGTSWGDLSHCVKLDIRGELDPVRLQHALDSLAVRHEALSAQFAPVSG